jgi:hypothetical protein
LRGPGFKSEGMNNFLSENNVGRDVPPCYKSRLSLRDIIREMRLNSISKRFGNKFVNNIAEANWPKVLGGRGVRFFRYEGKKGLIDVLR